jgi:hypothetical protein
VVTSHLVDVMMRFFFKVQYYRLHGVVIERRKVGWPLHI